ncbi:MAG: serine/threonine protein kinase [Planctomycetota bacterium]|jgi:serine/threonine protein kinase
MNQSRQESENAGGMGGKTTVAAFSAFSTRMMTQDELDNDGTIVLAPSSANDMTEENSDLKSQDEDAFFGEAEESRCGFIPGYSILGSLGEGGMGVVYQAIQERLQRVVALKVLRPSRVSNADFVERFEREAMAVARLNHPNIVTAYDYGEVDGRFYLAIEYVEGRDGAELIAYEGRLIEREAIELIRDAVLGLSHALSHGIIHRDVKPANLMLTSQAAQDASGGLFSGRLKVTDLGLAQIRENAGELYTDTIDSGKIVGTPSYMSPEQARGEEVDFRGDIYALGATLYHFLTGIKPFEGETSYEILEAKIHSHMTHPQDLVATISDDTCLVLDRMMAKHRDARYQNYEDLLLDLVALLAGRKPVCGQVESHLSSFDKPKIRRSILRKHRAASATPLAFRLRLVATPLNNRKNMAWKALTFATLIGLGFGMAWLLFK